MENTKNYAESSALKWQSEDFDGTVESLLDGEEISKETAIKLLSLDQIEKVEIIECAIERIAEQLMEAIYESIREQIIENQQNNG